MNKQSAGLLAFRRDRGGQIEVLLVHPGGPFWAKKDTRAWSVPKGEFGGTEDARAVAVREFEEELGTPPPDGPQIDLGTVKQSGGKVVHAWAVEGNVDAGALSSNTFEMEWPPRSGKTATFPEVDRAEWFSLNEAEVKLLAGQRPFLDRLAGAVAAQGGAAGNTPAASDVRRHR